MPATNCIDRFGQGHSLPLVHRAPHPCLYGFSPPWGGAKFARPEPYVGLTSPSRPRRQPLRTP
eukprot:5769175-Prymnesium_polylepis.1